MKPKISVINSSNDIVTLGALYIASEVNTRSQGNIQPVVYHSGVLSGGKGIAEIEMCQQGSIEMHITSTAYLANLVPQMSLVSLPFLFRDLDQVIAVVANSCALFDTINEELREKNLHIITWWPRGFRQLTNSRSPVKNLEDVRGLKLRVMNNPLYVDIMNAMRANPVPMEWGEVYNALQLKTIDGQENAEDVIYSARLYEIQDYLTIWDYSIDLEVVIVNWPWWNQLTSDQQNIILQAAHASIEYESDLLRENTIKLRKEIEEHGMEIYYMNETQKDALRQLAEPVWRKYEARFSPSLIDDFLAELKKY